MDLKIYNTLTRQKEVFVPEDPKRVRMYSCGPTVYNYIHIGNGRMAVVFDVVHRVLAHIYGEEHVTHAQNITDVDDKIIEAARQEGVSIDAITKRYTAALQEDREGLGCRPLSKQPLCTEYIDEMQKMISALIDKGHAYNADGNVLFSVPSMADYGQLSRMDRDSLVAGARVEVSTYKQDPVDFTLWKPSKTADEPGWSSPWGRGRPGWHIECSAMSRACLGETFDIHGGGLDLIFPHHENEIAQSRCANETPYMAKYWMHNGFLNMDNEKMSKSLGNFHFVHDLLKEWPGEVLRLALLSAHYRQPLNYNLDLLKQSKQTLDKWYSTIQNFKTSGADPDKAHVAELVAPTLHSLCDDFNTPQVMAELHKLMNEIVHKDTAEGGVSAHLAAIKIIASLLGILQTTPAEWFNWRPVGAVSSAEVEGLISARNAAKQSKNYAEADRIRKELTEKGIALEDGPQGTTWRYVGNH